MKDERLMVSVLLTDTASKLVGTFTEITRSSLCCALGRISTKSQMYAFRIAWQILCSYWLSGGQTGNTVFYSKSQRTLELI